MIRLWCTWRAMWAICVYYSRTISMADRKWENRRQVKVGCDGVDQMFDACATEARKDGV